LSAQHSGIDLKLRGELRLKLIQLNERGLFCLGPRGDIETIVRVVRHILVA
jgi:hypothetical protein